ncbi:MAG: hypothetical protein QGH04_03670 [Candidatus Marinimicrobia bacterium]|nr:hypothetical protein [Candidatus Neomarinimicrobiota bacterium]
MKLKDLSVKEDIRKKMINSILVILFALSTSLMGATIYVNSSSGDDTNGDGSSGLTMVPCRPWLSLLLKV